MDQTTKEQQYFVRMDVRELTRIIKEKGDKKWDANTLADIRELLESSITSLDVLEF